MFDSGRRVVEGAALGVNEWELPDWYWVVYDTRLLPFNNSWIMVHKFQFYDPALAILLVSACLSKEIPSNKPKHTFLRVTINVVQCWWQQQWKNQCFSCDWLVCVCVVCVLLRQPIDLNVNLIFPWCRCHVNVWHDVCFMALL